jgi:hypothetical protein
MNAANTLTTMSSPGRWSVIRSVRNDPFHLTESSPGNYSLLLTEFLPADEVFAEAGREGGGYGWELVANRVAEDLGLCDRLDFDPEATVFCAYGGDREALEELGAELARLFNDEAALRGVIDRVPATGTDD